MSVCKHIGKDGICVLHSEPFYKEPCSEGPCNDYETMNDLISKQAAIEAVGDVHPMDYNGQAILHRLRELPITIIDPVKHGKLIASEETNSGGLIRMVCSECNREVYSTYGLRLGGIQFCPYCGVKFEGEEDE